jgi:DNA ligase (NAD+)
MNIPLSQTKILDLTKNFLNNAATTDDLSHLRQALIFHEHRYYVENDPLISDFEYDTLYKQLVKIEEAHPELIAPDSPSQRVSVDLTGDLPPVQHTIPMLSLDNSYDEEDLNAFDTAIKKICGIDNDTALEYCVEPKFDGGSIALVYENDLLTRGATRGNGVMGEEMTANAKAMPSIPLKALFSQYGIVKAELRGEALIRKDNFDRINGEREKDGLTLFANPRNAATGGLRTKDPNETRRRGLDAFIYQLGYAVDANGVDKVKDLGSHHNGIELLGDLGFKIPKTETKVCKNIEEVHAFVREWEAKRDDYAYEIDGMVVKVNSLEIQEKCGFTSHHPRWAIAFKFKAKQATSRLVGVDYQVGKIGSITPVAKIDPVYIAGVTVSSISLHNAEFIQSKDLRIGDTVLVERAGDVIPYIVKSFPELRSGKEEAIVFPEFCPINNTESPVSLVQEGGEAAWRCPNCVCGAQDLQRMIFHVSKEAMDIDGFGKSYVERFYELGWLKDMSDLYNLDYEAISKLDGFGSRSSDKIKDAIQKARKNPIQKLLHSLTFIILVSEHLSSSPSRLLMSWISKTGTNKGI